MLYYLKHAWRLAAVLASTPALLPAQSDGATPAQLARVDSLFRRWDNTQSPGFAVGVSRDGRILLERGYGMAITPASIFHVASISKQFTAFAVMLLAQDGKLSLNDDLRRYVPEVPDYGRRITIRHLMQHTSGLRDQWVLLRLAGWRADDLITEEDVLWAVGRQRATNFAPGEEYLYSNTGFTLLAVMVKRVSGKSLREFAEERIFRPLGMGATHFHDDHTMIVPNRTSAYQPKPNGGWRISIPVFDTYGATSLFTTARDLLLWERNFADGKAGSPDGCTSAGTAPATDWGSRSGTIADCARSAMAARTPATGRTWCASPTRGAAGGSRSRCSATWPRSTRRSSPARSPRCS